MSDPIEDFKAKVRDRLDDNGRDKDFAALSNQWMAKSFGRKYSYNFRAFGRPIIQYPQDMVAMQELIWDTQPDFIIETGIAHGGSLIWYAGLLELNAACGGPKDARILGIDIDIRAHNRAEIEKHPLARRIDMIQGSSIDAGVVGQVKEAAAKYRNIMVILDSNHTHEHVYEELKAYAPLTSVGNYCVVFDTIVEDIPDDLHSDRNWGTGDNPKTAVKAYLAEDDRFETVTAIDNKLLISVAPEGYLRRTK
jgi:cephalosporin hydroxylase